MFEPPTTACLGRAGARAAKQGVGDPPAVLALSSTPSGPTTTSTPASTCCGKGDVPADVEVIPIQKVNEAYERLLKSDVKYRFSIDMAFLRTE